MRDSYSANVVHSSLLVVLNNAISSIFFAYSESLIIPSLRILPNDVQNLIYFSRSDDNNFFSSTSIFLCVLFLITRVTGSSCKISREMLSGKSSESITPLMNRKYSGINSLQSFMMNTRLIYKLMPPDSGFMNISYGASDGINNKPLKLVAPSALIFMCVKGSRQSCVKCL